MTADAVVLGAWALLVVGAGLARLRWSRLTSGGGSLARALETLEVRRGVLTVIAVRLPGLEDWLRRDPVEACRFLHLIHPMLEKLASQYHGELEAPGAHGFRIFLGRSLPNPDHRASALDLTLRLREALAPFLAAHERDPAKAAIVTGEAVSAPFPTPQGSGVRSFGKALEAVDELSSRASPGEILVDRESAVPDAEFEFGEHPEGRLLVGRRTDGE